MSVSAPSAASSASVFLLYRMPFQEMRGQPIRAPCRELHRRELGASGKDASRDRGGRYREHGGALHTLWNEEEVRELFVEEHAVVAGIGSVALAHLHRGGVREALEESQVDALDRSRYGYRGDVRCLVGCAVKVDRVGIGHTGGATFR